MSSVGCFERDLIGDTSKHDCSASLWLASTARATIRSRFGLLCGALIVVAAVASSTAAFLWALPVVFAVLFCARLLDGHARQAAMRRARVLPIRLPEPCEFSDGAVRTVIQRLAYARQVITHVLGQGPRGPGFDLTSAVAQVPRLERDAVVLSQRAEYVARFLADHPVGEVAADDRRHGQQIEREQDPERVNLLRRIGARLKDRLESSRALQREYENLIDSARDAVEALEGVPARMMLLQLRRLQACTLPSAALSDADPGELDESLREVERALAADRVTTPSAEPITDPIE
jgi:hypothetical protein